MITEIKQLADKYKRLSKTSEYICIKEVLNDLYWLEQDARLKKIPKHLK